MSNNENSEVRYCKKCGCELASTNKHELCDNCRREKNKRIREFGLSFIGIAASALFAFGIGNKVNDNNHNNHK